MKMLAFIVAMLVPTALQAQVVPGSVTGQLLQKEGLTVAGVRISAMAVPELNVAVSATSTLVSLTVTDNAGRYRLDNVPPGRYYIIAGLIDSPTYYPGVSTMNSATAIAVTAGATVPNINFPMVVPQGFTVSGRVIRPPTVSPLATRAALLGAGPPILETTLNTDGSFQFTKVRPGNYTLMVSPGQLSRPVTLVVADKDIDGVEALILPTGMVSGRVVVEGNGLLPRFTLTLAPFSGGITLSNLYIAANGSFQTPVPEGEYRVTWSGLPAGYLLKSIMSGTTDLLASPLKVANGSAPPFVVTLGVASPVPWVKVSGRVRGLPSNSSTLPRITMTGSSVAETLEVPLKPDGSFEFPRVLPGTYTARFNPQLSVPVTSIVVGSKDMDSVEIVLPNMRELTGRVIVEGIGAVAPRLTFTWFDSASGSTNPANVVNQPDGTFKVSFPEGERRVTLYAPGYAVRSLTYGPVDLLRDPLKVTSTSSDEFRVTLTPAATAGGVGVGTGTGVVGGVLGGVVGGVPGGVVGGVPGGVLTTIIAPPPITILPPPLPPASPTSSQGTPTRIGGDVAQANLVSSVRPQYPEPARAARVTGVVILQAVITKEGVVESVNVITGHALLTEAAVEAVKQWRYKPQPTPVVTTITVNFTMQ